MARSEPVDADDDLAHAAGLYALGEINEGKAAEIAEITRWEMREILDDAGLELRHGPRTVEGVREDAGLATDEHDGE
jgi:predicted HTH domain antitoxin